MNVAASEVGLVTLHEELTGVRGIRGVENAASPVSLDDHSFLNRELITDTLGQATNVGGNTDTAVKVNHSRRTKSCPPCANRSIVSGPCSLEWLHDHNHGDAGIVFSSKKKKKKIVERSGLGQDEGQHVGLKRSKNVGMLRHYNLKKVARLPCKDRSEVLKILAKSVHRRGGKTSVNRSNAEKDIELFGRSFFNCFRQQRLATLGCHAWE
ncbi:hypothetical protein TSUD_55020 [Trifolium subterraneum]|uniref:Uncharacterized protein n=1 Tax=Trifolium subterraneum TaxID=3900 RepID=A0A2Z6M973_TRISU|nr:hypothetical protein TSUD_55020 [Trifolium subterraneum]